MASAVALVAAVIGLGASIASLVDYLAPQAAFCAETGCETVRASVWAHPLGIPMPVLGIAFFVTMIALCFVDRPRVRVALAATGAAWAVALIGLQAFVIHAWCKLCMIADPAAIVGGLAVLAGARMLRARWLAPVAPLAGATVLALSLFAHHAPEPMPADTPAAVVKAQQPGVVTVVEFVDFECPFCRALAPKLAEALRQAHVPVRVVRKMVPLPMHPHALPAALAWCCAAAQGKGDAMADALFAAPADELTTEGCEKIAAQVGCDVDRYRRELPAMVGVVAGDMLDARAGNVHSLPTVFVGPERVVGANHTPADLIAKIERAAR
ncbi:MAG: thioredoxin domain-containing protein [Deltaproteobacteria bacterium]|nr:thioredoxin domain-containing protein [Deltaproteobacteria bacterium]